MPKECLVYVKYKDGHSCIGICRLVDDAPFAYNEMKKWIMEDDCEIVEVRVSKVPAHLKKAIQNVIQKS